MDTAASPSKPLKGKKNGQPRPAARRDSPREIAHRQLRNPRDAWRRIYPTATDGRITLRIGRRLIDGDTKCRGSLKRRAAYTKDRAPSAQRPIQSATLRGILHQLDTAAAVLGDHSVGYSAWYFYLCAGYFAHTFLRMVGTLRLTLSNYAI